MVDSKKYLSANYDRRFGVEIEVNSFDIRDFKKHKLKQGMYPVGMEVLGTVIADILNCRVDLNDWGYTHNNNSWVLKRDSSCGIEVCSPVVRGWKGISDVCQVVESFGKLGVSANKSCSLHIHVDVSDLSQNQVCSILAYWIKCEHIFLDSVPESRKKNRYCQQIGVDIDDREIVDSKQLLQMLSEYKYYTVNTYHYVQNGRKTIEFRILDGEGCLNPFTIKNWIKLILHFVEMTKDKMFLPPKLNDVWSGLYWLDLDDVMKVLCFSDEFDLSPGLKQVYNWIVGRILKNIESQENVGVITKEARKKSINSIYHLVEKNGGFNKSWLESLDKNEIYGTEYRI